MLPHILALFARISKPLWLNIRSRGAEVTGRQTEDFLAMDTASWTSHCPKSHDQDRDRDSRDPRPRPRPRLWGSKTETKTCKNGSRDVSRARLKSREELQVCWEKQKHCFWAYKTCCCSLHAQHCWWQQKVANTSLLESRSLLKTANSIVHSIHKIMKMNLSQTDNYHLNIMR